MRLIWFPVCAIRVKKFNNKKSREEIIDFVFNKIFGILRPLQVREEISELAKIVEDKKPKTILEIGTAKGGTLFIFSKIAYQKATIISVDLPGGAFGGGYPRSRAKLYSRFALPLQKIFLLRMNSHENETFEKVKNLLGERKIDFLFIDGDHTYQGVKIDFEKYSYLVKKGGLIALHDVAVHPVETKCEVYKFWNELQKKYNSREIIKNKEQGWGGIGIIKK